MKRRRWMLQAAAGAGCSVMLRPPRVAASVRDRSQDIPPEVESEIRRWAGATRWAGTGLEVDLPEIVDNGNDVPVTLRLGTIGDGTPRPQPWAAAGRTTALHLALWAPRNPQPLVLEAEFGPACPLIELTTRIRLATSQRLVAVLRDGSGSALRVERPVLVALAACVEG